MLNEDGNEMKFWKEAKFVAARKIEGVELV